MNDPAATDTAVQRLETGLADLRVPHQSADTESMLTKLGVALPLVGLALVALAWWNASDTEFVADQIPMLISGGLLGLGLVVIGLGLFVRFSVARLFRFWSARMLAENQLQTDRVVEALGRVETALRERVPQP